MQKEFTGLNGKLIIGDTGVMFKRDHFDRIFNKLSGNKTIPYRTITAVQFKKAGIFSGNGYLQLTILGGQETHGGAASAKHDENTITFTFADNARFAEAKSFIEQKLIS